VRTEDTFPSNDWTHVGRRQTLDTHAGHPPPTIVDGQELFFSHVGLRGGPAPVRAYVPDLIDRVFSGRINPGRVVDLALPLDTRSPKVARPWTNAAPSRRCYP
jgi:hypothetical protein